MENKERVWIDKPGPYKVMVSKVMMSESVEGFTGCPFVKFYCETPDGKSTGIKFFRTREQDNDRVKQIKQERIAKFIRNAGGHMQGSDAKTIFESVVGRDVYVLLSNKEYVGRDTNHNNKPVVKTTIDYLFSSNKEITKVKPDMLEKKLSVRDEDYFKTQYDMWKSTQVDMVKDAFDAVEDTNKHAEDEGLPF
tara:strand:- start:370 stop:948 length:579 start_codon:yes stop_codon:yes gene_type:complete